MGLLDDAIRDHLDLKRRHGADPAEIQRAEQEALGPVRREPAMTTGQYEDEHHFDDSHEDDVDATFVTSASPAEDIEVTSISVHDELDIEPMLIHDDFDDGFDNDLPFAGASTRTSAKDEPGIDLSPVEPPLDSASDDTPRAGGIASPGYSDPHFDEFHQPAEGKLRRRLFSRRDKTGEHPVVDPSALEEHAPAAAPEPAAPEHHDYDDDPFADPPEQQSPPSLRIATETELGHTVEYDVESAFAEEDKDGEDLLESTPEFLADAPEHDRLWFEQQPPRDFDFDK